MGFRFETCWLLDEGCETVVKLAWDDSAGEGVIGRLTLMAFPLRKNMNLGNKMNIIG